jgi:hypothetical protein
MSKRFRLDGEGSFISVEAVKKAIRAVLIGGVSVFPSRAYKELYGISDGMGTPPPRQPTKHDAQVLGLNEFTAVMDYVLK